MCWSVCAFQTRALVSALGVQEMSAGTESFADKKRDAALDWLWQPEALLAGWLSASFLLTTLSLLFYHMVKVSSLEMSSNISGIFAIGLIVSSVVLSCIAVITYDRRTRTVMRLAHLNDRSTQEEKTFHRVYTIACIAIMCIQIGIVCAIARGTLRSS